MSSTPKFRHGGPVSEEGGSQNDDRAASGSLRDRLPVRGGLLAGVGAVLTSTFFAAIVVGSSRRGTSPWEGLESPPGMLTETSWLVLTNLGAGVDLGEETGTVFGYSGYQLLNLSPTPVYELLFFGIVVTAGYAVAECVTTDSRLERAGGALLVVPAYIVGASTLALVSTWEPPADVGGTGSEFQEVSVSAVDAAIYAGILVPAALALLGGCLSVARRAWLEHRQPL